MTQWQNDYPDLVVSECPFGCKDCPKLWINDQIRHQIICNCLCHHSHIASLSMEDQRHLFEVMEEGKLTRDKYGFHKEIDSPTTVLGTTNPESGEWYFDVIDKGQIPLRKELVDRYDLILVFKSLKNKEQKVDYGKKKFYFEE